MLEQAGLVGHGVRSALNMHRTRHTFATEMRRVARVEAASQALSHSDLSTTLGIYGHQDYGHQDQRDLERAMELFARTREAKRPQAGGTIRRRSSTEPLDLQEKWRRRESNPRKIPIALALPARPRLCAWDELGVVVSVVTTSPTRRRTPMLNTRALREAVSNLP